MSKEIFSDLLTKAHTISGWVEFPSPESIEGNKSRIWYFADKDGQKCVIKQYPEWVNEKDILWIHSYMSKLFQKGFPLAESLAEPLQFDKHFYAVYSFADGTKYDPLNKFHFVDMALKLGQLHSLSQNIKIGGNRNWPVVAGYNYQDGNEFLTYAWKVASGLLQNSNGSIMPIHGDFRKDNIRFNQNGISKIFDFGNARNDYPEVDLATTLRDVAGELDLSNWLKSQSEFLQIYKNSNAREVKILPDLICASNLILAIQENSYLIHEYSENKGEGIKNALEKESVYLSFLLKNLDTQLSLYKGVFI